MIKSKQTSSTDYLIRFQPINIADVAVVRCALTNIAPFFCVLLQTFYETKNENSIKLRNTKINFHKIYVYYEYVKRNNVKTLFFFFKIQIQNSLCQKKDHNQNSDCLFNGKIPITESLDSVSVLDCVKTLIAQLIYAN